MSLAQIRLYRMKIRTYHKRYIITGASILMAAFGNRYANVIAKTAAYAFQHRYSKDYIIVISSFPVTFIQPTNL